MALKVLLVDDNQPFLRAVQRFLDTLPGVSVVGCAHDGHEALAQAERLRPDLVLLDVVMPGMDGFKVALALKAKPSPPRIVILSLHDDEAYRASARLHGAEAFVRKDKFAVELIPIIIQTLFAEFDAGRAADRALPRP